MAFLKRIIIGGAALFFIFLGGAGTQSNNMLVQGGGFIGLIIGLITIYFFARMAWRAMGCLPSIAIVILLITFVLYAIGAFSGGIRNTGKNLKTFLGQNTAVSQQIYVPQNQPQPKQEEKEAYVEDGNVNLVGEDNHPILKESLSETLFPQKKQETFVEFNPMNYPAIIGLTRVVSGDMFYLNNSLVKLYGVAAPHTTQTCADSYGRGYRCGQQAFSWLSGWLAENEVKCHILHEAENGILTAVCMLGEYDIGAAIVNSGWAVADIRETSAYKPYQSQAEANQRGLWQGRFYMPWDWEKIKMRKNKVRIIKKEKKRKSVWGI